MSMLGIRTTDVGSQWQVSLDRTEQERKKVADNYVMDEDIVFRKSLVTVSHFSLGCALGTHIPSSAI